jgi:hypothetical protein
MTWNDCPICGAKLVTIPPDSGERMACSGMPLDPLLSNPYWSNISKRKILNDCFQLGNTLFSRAAKGLHQWGPDIKGWIVLFEIQIPFDKITQSYIEKLLLLR